MNVHDEVIDELMVLLDLATPQRSGQRILHEGSSSSSSSTLSAHRYAQERRAPLELRAPRARLLARARPPAHAHSHAHTFWRGWHGGHGWHAGMAGKAGAAWLAWPWRREVDGVGDGGSMAGTGIGEGGRWPRVSCFTGFLPDRSPNANRPGSAAPFSDSVIYAI